MGDGTKTLRIGLAGLGTVGVSVIKSLVQNKNGPFFMDCQGVGVVAVSARNRARDRGVDLSPYRWYDDPAAMAAADDIDCVVELIGGAEGAAFDTVRTALAQGKHVVTANKALLATHGLELAETAEQRGVALAFEAAVAGGIPVIKTLREALVGNRVTKVAGILNGTCNFILTTMESYHFNGGERRARSAAAGDNSRPEGDNFAFTESLAEAQRLGYAEADPTSDIEGFDSAYKLAILSSLAFGTVIDFDGVHTEGISRVSLFDLKMADELGFRIKLLGVAELSDEGLEQRVQPTMVLKNGALGGVSGVTNALKITADMIGELTLVGPGAGGAATASAVLSDIADVAKGRVVRPFGIAGRSLKRAPRRKSSVHTGGFYIRVRVFDRPGVAAQVTRRMAEQGISLESILQKRDETAARIDPAGRSGAPVPVVLITYATTEDAVRTALERMQNDELLTEQPLLVRIERT
ncbi:MAG: homoserine dehydrogenase [Methylobacteriaceae bacterium]|jgi:homoserine dehydrogenase|nr:homoserine dehydrogenase [Methylobacteriaceae bacterium]